MLKELEMKVFISSTFIDLKEYREAAIKVVNRYKGVPLAMEFFMSQSEEPTKVCKKEIHECDVFVGIYAHRYGFIPGGKKKSITQQEYELAKKLKKDCLCFIIDKDFPWKPRFIEHDKQKELGDFLKDVKTERTCSFFTTAADFEIKLSTSIGKFIAGKSAAAGPGEKRAADGACIPVAPTPFIAHPYPLLQNFTGRDAEQAMLSNWLFNEEKPVLVIEAIGGMGKSALTWVWLHNHILEPGVEIDGVFWWSFYEDPFETFLQKLACYVMEKQESHTLLSADLPDLQAALHQRRFLLVLDGLERALRGYSGMEAMFIQEKKFQGSADAETQWEKQQREPVHPLAARFLRHLASGRGKSRVLITSRLMPVPLEDLEGVKHVFLKGLAPGDGVRFLRGEGVKGTRAELEQAGNVYDFHPLMLKLLASAIKRSRTKDVQEAFRLNLIHTKEPHKILTTSFKMLSKKEREVVSKLSAFRSVFTFESAKAFFPNMKEDLLWELMVELRGLGFLFYDEKQDRFDFHPILRSFLYHNLTNRADIHTQAVQYFQALPGVEKIVTLGDLFPLIDSLTRREIVTLEDLFPVIELYYHLVKAEKFTEAFKLFKNSLHEPCYYQLSTYHLIIDLLKGLFPEGEMEDHLPCLEDEEDQAWALAALANTYALSGQPAKAAPLHLQCINISEEEDDRENLAIGLTNLAQEQLIIGQLYASTKHLLKSISLCRDTGYEFWEAHVHLELGRVLTYQGRIKIVKGASTCAEAEWNKAIFFFKKSKDNQGLSMVYASRSLSELLQARLAAVLHGEKKKIKSKSQVALEHSLKALALLEKDTKGLYPHIRNFVQAYWLLGEAFIQCRILSANIRIESSDIPFFDEYFQHTIDGVKLEKGKEWAAAERCLNEALRRCRKVNLVELEPDILLAHARLLHVKKSPLASIEKNLEEALDIAQRAGYRLKLADLHLFCGQVLSQSREKQTLLGLKAHEHLEKTKEYALDVSEFSHLYQSPDPDFYKGIPEYQMLKRGMTKEERIKNGYWPAYRMAEVLLGT
jgi:tetratricopeptide (TPR) repeat protein